MSNINNTIEYIVSETQRDAQGFVAMCEARYEAIIDGIAKRISETPASEIVMLAGPSSAGKTTSARKLSEHLASYGVRSFTISLDDYYLNRDSSPRLPDGSPDYETVHALDVPLIVKTLSALMTDGKTELPEFDFITGTRKPEYRVMEISDSDVIIVEGLHALNPIVTDELPADRLLKLYINVSSRIYDEKGDIILNKRNMRFIRRMVRDYHSRASSPEHTFTLWGTVCDGEGKYLFPFRDNADIKINTIHLYETCVLKDEAIELLSGIKKDSPFYSEAERLVRSLGKFPSIPRAAVPEDSLIREFIGKKED